MAPVTSDPSGLARWLDHIAVTDFGGRDVAPRLLAAATALYGKPASLRAAEVLSEARLDGGHAIITAGFVLTGYANAIETDGPPGAVIIARALVHAFGTKVLLLTDPPGVPVMEACARAVGLNVLPAETLLSLDRVRIPAIAVRELPFDAITAQPIVTRILAQWVPDALISVEKPGPNEHGVCHLIRGESWSEHSAPVGLLFQQRPEGAVTVGIGDFGNEIGMGTIRDKLLEILPQGRVCACPCHGSVFDATVVDAVVPAAISNWGACAIVGVLSAMLERPTLFPTPAEERRVLEAAIAAGAVEGLSGAPVFGVDGVSIDSDAAVIQLMGDLVAGYGNLRAHVMRPSTQGTGSKVR